MNAVQSNVGTSIEKPQSPIESVLGEQDMIISDLSMMVERMAKQIQPIIAKIDGITGNEKLTNSVNHGTSPIFGRILENNNKLRLIQDAVQGIARLVEV